MESELPVQSITAIATLVAALIAAAISFVNLTLNKEQKTSEFRQAWIDGLRNDLSVFFACARAFARASEELHKIPDGANPIQITSEKISEIRYQVAEAYGRIMLRLNPEEAEHNELLRLMDRTLKEQNLALAERADAKKTIAALEAAMAYARPVLKTEWRRVKEGELAFRIARNWLAPAIFTLSIFAIIFVWNGAFKC